jgi:protein-S-isoprenylcysteine O-methyltransferase Ste14
MINAGFLVIPIVVIRYALLAALSRDALRRAAYFAPPKGGGEKAAYWVNMAASFGIIIYPFFITADTGAAWFYAGLGVYIIGAALYIISLVNYAKPGASGLNTGGLYRFSRNPMYVSYFIYFLGCAVMAKSLILLAILIVFQVSTHFLILPEERWCLEKFGDEYGEYMKRVRRYI